MHVLVDVRASVLSDGRSFCGMQKDEGEEKKKKEEDD